MIVLESAVVGLTLLALTASLVSWIDRYRALSEWRARPPDGRQPINVEVRSRLPMHLVGEANARVVDAPALGQRLSRWAIARRFTPTRSDGTTYSYARGSALRASFAFGVGHVPTTVVVSSTSSDEARVTMEIRSSLQIVGAADREEASVELASLIDAIEDRPAARRDAR